MTSIKQHRFGILETWLAKFKKNAGAKYQLNKLGEKLDVVSGFTAVELQVINGLLAAAYSSGCHETREHFAELKRAK